MKENDKKGGIDMYLVMTEEKPLVNEKVKIEMLLKGKMAQYPYDGQSTTTIGKNLAKEVEGTVIVTADSRLLTFVHIHFDISNVYLYRNGRLIQLTDIDHKILRSGYNLPKLYEMGALTAPSVG